MQLLFNVLVSAFLFLLAIIWKKNTWLNIFFKLITFFLSFWGVFLTLKELGYIVKN